MGRDSATTASLAPGFRFHPTDEELVIYYLKRKVCGKSFRFDAISDVDIYKSEPWDLPGHSRLKSRDLEWYFFSALDKKYGNGSRTNRATDQGYWKTTGKDRPVRHYSRTVGMKKTLVFHSGRAPRGERTNWVMHEYRLVDEELEKAGVVQDAFVLCRIFQKSGSGPKNGEQYGAPFIEEEWDDDKVVLVPGEKAADESVVGDDLYFEANDFEQQLDIGIPSENTPLPLNFYYGDSSNYVAGPRDFIEDGQKHLVGVGENHCGPEVPDDQKFFVLPEQHEVDTKSVKDDYPVDSSKIVNPVDANYLLGEPYLDATYNPPFDDGLFLETNDLSAPVEADPAGFDMVDEYLTFFDADDDNSHYAALGSSEMMGIDNPVFEQTFLTQNTQKLVNGGGIDPVSMANHHLKAHGNDGASSSNQTPEATKFESDIQYSFIKQASRMLGSIPAPPAFASEFPTKEAALLLNSAAQSSGSVHVTAGVIRIRNMTLTGNRTDWSFGKDGHINFILSFGLPQGDVNSASLEPMTSIFSGKTGSAVSRNWFYFIFFWVLIFSVTFKIGSYICTR